MLYSFILVPPVKAIISIYIYIYKQSKYLSQADLENFDERLEVLAMDFVGKLVT